MRIGIMLRSLDEKGGVGVYTRYITEELLAIDRRHHYTLFYSSPQNLGRYAGRLNVVEQLVRAPNKLIWDQFAIPYWAWRHRIDVLFHPKFTVPLLSTCPSVMVLHGAGWFIPEFSHFWSAADVRYIRALMPLYCRRASRILSVSDLTTDLFNQKLGLPAGKVQTVYFAPGKQFRRETRTEILETVRARYNLPDQFILTLSRYDGGARKNIGGILKAYEHYHGTTPHQLIVGGKGCERFRADFALSDNGFGGDVQFPGWIDQSDLPAVYSLASLFLYPSNLEAFPIPLTEAMACGTPIITSNQNGLREIAGDGALFVEADDTRAIARAMSRVLQDSELHASLTQKALARSSTFNWERCARQTLEVLESVAPRVREAQDAC